MNDPRQNTSPQTSVTLREVNKEVSKGLFGSNFHCSINTSMFIMRNMNGELKNVFP